MGGLYYEELEVGTTIEHEIRRTMTEMDNVLFSTMSLNPQPLHLDAEFSKTSLFGQRLVNSIFTLGCVTGITVVDTTLGTTVGNLGFEEVKFPNPMFHGDTLHVVTEIIDKRESKSRPTTGIVNFRHVGYNQRDEIVCECSRAALMLKRPSASEGT
jgi:acyl dehydratase